MTEKNVFSQRLRDFRKRAGLKQVQLAELSGIDPNLVSRYERGESVPTLETAQKIAFSLGINIDELLNGPAKQEFDVKILMGVKSLTGLAGVEVASNTFFYGVEDDEPQIVMGGRVRIDTPEMRAKARELILKKFDAACRMFDLKDKIEAGE